MEKIGLNYNWKFSLNDSIEEQVVNIPHEGITVPINHFKSSKLENISTYTKELEITKEDLKKSLLLYFEGAAHLTKVYLNDNLIITNYGGYIPFSTFINPIEGTNILKVIVDSHENPNIPPFGGVVDYLGFAGLYREVYLIKKPKNHVSDIKVSYNDILNNNEIEVLVTTNSNKGLVELEILNNNKEIIYEEKKEVNSTNTKFIITIKDKILWDLDNPYLYNLNIKYEGAAYKQRFGLRDAVFKKDGFYLNGNLIKLIGLNRHQSYPYVGYAMPKGAQEEDAVLLKEMGLNIVRTSHYPQSKHFLNKCDEIGLLVFPEITGWQHIGDLKWQDLSILNLERMIERDKNHPSIIIWGTRINESADNHDFYKTTSAKARELDPTRQIGGVRNMPKSEFFEDVYTYNDFYHDGIKPALSRKKDITKINTPYLVTEHNGHMFPTKSYDNEQKRLEHALRHLRVIDSAKNKNNKISGAIGWVFSDYQTHEEFGSGDLICHHGVLDIYRNKKFASYSYIAEMSKEPVLFVASDMNIGEYPTSNLEQVYVFTNLDYIELYKNNEYIKTFYPNNKEFKHLNHPPIIVDDFIGGLMSKNEGLSIKDGERAKKVLKAVQKDGTFFSLKTKLTILYLLTKYKLSMDEGVSLFYKYLSNWGTKQSDYTFKGYKDKKLVKEVNKSIYKEYSYKLEVTRDILNIDDTYDATRVTITKVCQNGHQANYSFDPVEINLDNLELVGPRIQTLNSGILSFWVKTKKEGKAKINVKINGVNLNKELKVNAN